MTYSNQQYRWLTAQRNYRNLQERIMITKDKSLLTKLLIKLNQLQLRLLSTNKKWKASVAASIMLFWLSLAPTQAQFSSPFELSSLDGNNGFAILAQTSQANIGFDRRFGHGDINHDGLQDLIIAAGGTDQKVYVIFGSSNFPSSLNLQVDGNNGFAINTTASTIGSGDINGDGIDDVVIGNESMNSNVGGTIVLFGKSTGSFSSQIEISDLNGSNGFVLNGIDANDRAGESLAVLNMDGDSYDDLAIGSFRANPNGITLAGETYVVFGNSSFPASFDLSSLDGSNGFTLNGIDEFDRSAEFLGATDINGDGYDDLAIHALLADPGGLANGGETYIVYGKNTAMSGNYPAQFNLSSLDGTDGFTFYGANVNDFLGQGLAGMGDINDDGIDDFFMKSASTNGETHVVYGSTIAFPSIFQISSLDGTNGFTINGANSGDGVIPGQPGDFNGDGIQDIIVGSSACCVGGITSPGSAYIVYGKSSGFPATFELSNLSSSDGVMFNGVNAEDLAGHGVSSVGDVNGDGIDDLAIGAWGVDLGMSNDRAGAIYIVYGQLPPDTSPPTIESLTPGDGAIDVAVDAHLIIDFDENVVKGSGNITIKRSSDNTDVEVIDVSTGQVSITDDVVTIDPLSDLPLQTDLYILINDTAFEDESGNGYAGIDDTETWNFRSKNCEIPSGLIAGSITNTDATLSWDDVNPGELYDLEYQPVGGSWTLVSGINASQHLLDNVLDPGTRYKYRVRGVCMINEEMVTTDFSPVAQFETTIDGCDIPTGLSATPIGNTSANITWTGSTSDNYILEYRNQDLAAQPWVSVDVNMATSHLLDNVLLAGTQYKYRVTRECVLENNVTVLTDTSAPMFFTTGAAGCDVPTGLMAVIVNNTSATISWSGSTADNYLLEYRNQDLPGQPWVGVNVNMATSTLLNNVLNPGTRYKYRVSRECDLSGTIVNTPPSAASFFTTSTSGCDIPTNPATPVIGDTDVTITWDEVNTGVPGEAYLLEYRIASGGSWQQMAISGGTENLMGLMEGTRYKYRIFGQCELEMGVTVTTDPSAIGVFETTVSKELSDAPSLVEALTQGEEGTELKLLTYPNPSAGMVTLSFVPNETGTGRVSIYSLNGSKVYDREFEDRLEELIDLSTNGKGMYLVKVDFNGKVFQSRLLIE